MKSFYSNKPVKCHFLQDAIEEVEQEDVDAADFVLTDPSNVGNVTDEEEEDGEIFNRSGLPGEVSGEIEVVTRSIEPNSNMIKVKATKKVAMVMSVQENRKSRLKKPKIEKKKSQSGKRVI